MFRYFTYQHGNSLNHVTALANLWFTGCLVVLRLTLSAVPFRSPQIPIFKLANTQDKYFNYHFISIWAKGQFRKRFYCKYLAKEV